jgi:hypothetical protein
MRVRLHNKQAGMLAALIATLLLALPGIAEARPRIDGTPKVSGETTVGKTVTATGYTASGGTTSWSWIRCDGLDLDQDECKPIGGATSSSYTITSADVGKRLRVWVTVRNGRDESTWKVSAPSDVVQEAPKPPPPPPPAEPTPSPTPAPTATPEPTPAPVLAAPVPAGAVLGETVTRTPTMMRPAPTIRIRGRTTPGGAKITLLTVTAPRGARISLTCRGRSCPVKRWAKTSTVTRLLRFERRLATGTKLIIRVTKPGKIGKYSEIVIRSTKAPWRRDRCLDPGSRRPRKCPSV